MRAQVNDKRSDVERLAIRAVNEKATYSRRKEQRGKTKKEGRLISKATWGALIFLCSFKL